MKMGTEGPFAWRAKPPRSKLTAHPSVIKKWDIHNVEFHVAIKKNAF